MELLGVICVILSIAFIISLMIIADYRSTLKSKEAYDQMIELMEGERRLIKEDRVKITKDNAKLNQQLNTIRTQTNEFYHTLNATVDQFDTLAKRYIEKRIELLQAKQPDIKNSTSAMYKLQDLLAKKKMGQLSVMRYLQEIDLVFDGLQNGSYKYE